MCGVACAELDNAISRQIFHGTNEKYCQCFTSISYIGKMRQTPIMTALIL